MTDDDRTSEMKCDVKREIKRENCVSTFLIWNSTEPVEEEMNMGYAICIYYIHLLVGYIHFHLSKVISRWMLVMNEDDGGFLLIKFVGRG